MGVLNLIKDIQWIKSELCVEFQKIVDKVQEVQKEMVPEDIEVQKEMVPEDIEVQKEMAPEDIEVQKEMVAEDTEAQEMTKNTMTKTQWKEEVMLPEDII